jgi:hypothetical protein
MPFHFLAAEDFTIKVRGSFEVRYAVPSMEKTLDH